MVQLIYAAYFSYTIIQISRCKKMLEISQMCAALNVKNNGLSRGQMQKSHFIFSEHNAWLDFLAFLTLQKNAFYHFLNFYANAQCKMIES